MSKYQFTLAADFSGTKAERDQFAREHGFGAPTKLGCTPNGDQYITFPIRRQEDISPAYAKFAEHGWEDEFVYRLDPALGAGQ